MHAWLSLLLGDAALAEDLRINGATMLAVVAIDKNFRRVTKRLLSFIKWRNNDLDLINDLDTGFWQASTPNLPNMEVFLTKKIQTCSQK